LLHRVLFAPVLLFLAGCTSIPDTYAPPEQRPGVDPQVPRLGAYVRMGDPEADLYLVRDVSRTLEGGAWRWAFKRPELRFFVTSVERLRFVLEFTIAEALFPETGPVTLAVFVNGQLLASERYGQAGAHRFEKPVPPSLLKPGALNLVAIEPDKVWVSKEDGATLGFVLSGAGFVR
jgi:hypothetical protein